LSINGNHYKMSNQQPNQPFAATTRDELLDDMATAALNTFEMCCEWSKGVEAAREEAIEQGVRPTRSLVMDATTIARLRWEAIGMEVKNEISLQE